MYSVVILFIVCMVMVDGLTTTTTTTTNNNMLRENRLVQQFTALIPNPPLSYQGHGVNDVPAIPQYLLKGVRWFKIDAALADYNACSNFSTWSGTQSDCINKYCCVALRGDVSSIPDLSRPFNTSEDILSFFRDPQYRSFLTVESSPVVIQFYLSFGAATGQPQQQLFVDFVTQLNSTVHELNLNMVFTIRDLMRISDIACATGTCSEMDRTLSALPVELFTTYDDVGFPRDQDDPKKRTQMFNSGSEHYVNCCIAAWPDHQRADAYPYMWVEPSTQPDIVALLQQQLNCTTLPVSHRSIGAGVRVTCNQNPEMYEVFSSEYTKIGDNSMLSSKMTGMLHPRSAVLEEPNGGAKWLFPRFMVASYVNTANQSFITVTGLDDSDGKHGPTTFTASMDALVDSISTVDTMVLAVNHATLQTWLFTFDGVKGTLVLKNSDKLQAGTDNIMGTSLLCDNDYNCGIVTVSNSSKCSLQASLYTDSGKLISSKCSFSNGTVYSASVSVVLANDNLHTGMVVFEMFNKSVGMPAVYIGMINIERMSTVQLDVRSSLHFDFGATPHVHVYKYNGDIYAMNVHTDGKCSWGYAINNGNFDHCRIAEGIASATLLSVQYLLNYNFAPLQNFATAMHERKLSSTCSDLVFTGKYDTGVDPTVTLSTNPQTKMLEFHELHNADVAAPIVTQTICGNPIRKPGLVVDSFVLPQPSN